ncbi:MAG: c-type cytochrome [Deltaproteobacteria bacterium]|nr:c-type cytochrome [Deltaproteobacteria bacterium]
MCRSAFLIIVVLGCVLWGGCKRETDSAAKTTQGTGVADVAGAKAIFSGRCVACHGNTGAGDGPGAAALKPKPRAFADKAWQKSITDEQIKQTIVAGGLAVGKSALMPGNPDLKGKTAVLNGLVQVIRQFGK